MGSAIITLLKLIDRARGNCIMSNTVLVQNELLAFAFDSLNVDHRDCTEQIIDKFYDDSAVNDAKNLFGRSMSTHFHSVKIGGTLPP